MVFFLYFWFRCWRYDVARIDSRTLCICLSSRSYQTTDGTTTYNSCTHTNIHIYNIFTKCISWWDYTMCNWGKWSTYLSKTWKCLFLTFAFLFSKYIKYFYSFLCFSSKLKSYYIKIHQIICYAKYKFNSIQKKTIEQQISATKIIFSFHLMLYEAKTEKRIHRALYNYEVKMAKTHFTPTKLLKLCYCYINIFYLAQKKKILFFKTLVWNFHNL